MPTKTYLNPVHDAYFADPFVMEIDGAYWAYGTGRHQGELVFEVLYSDDLVSWRTCGGALERLPDADGYEYWAPEVARNGDTYYLYYSAGRDEQHRLRVATAISPTGPFRDTGVILTGDDPFTIDAHPFRDDDGSWYLYYARDFLDGDRVGTALVVDRMIDMTHLKGEPVTAVRATAEWQLYERDRVMYGNTYDWHTVEGPFMRKHGDLYFLFYSGGSWQRPNYGVSYAVAEHPLGPFIETTSDGPAILRSVPGEIIGPGHNSIVQGPDGEDYIVYHAWDAAQSARRMCIDRLRWGRYGPYCDGPSREPREAPSRARL